jgi:arylsulfatase A-like enzyme
MKGTLYLKRGGYASQPESHAAFAAMVNLLDDQVGEILHKIKELGIDKNTMVIFASDDGPHLEGGADPVYFNGNGPFKGFKRDLYEGGIRIPMLVCWPGKIKAGSYTDYISAMWDFLPTIVDILGVDSPDNLDGISYLPSLLGNKNQKQHDYLYWKLNIENGRYAVRQGIWKLIRYHNNSKIMTTELYNIEKDSAETINVAKDYPDITNNLLKILDQEEKKKFNLH